MHFHNAKWNIQAFASFSSLASHYIYLTPSSVLLISLSLRKYSTTAALFPRTANTIAEKVSYMYWNIERHVVAYLHRVNYILAYWTSVVNICFCLYKHFHHLKASFYRSQGQRCELVSTNFRIWNVLQNWNWNVYTFFACHSLASYIKQSWVISENIVFPISIKQYLSMHSVNYDQHSHVQWYLHNSS